MKIVFIVTGLPTGGAELMLLKLLERLDTQRFSPHVISLASLGDIGPRIATLGFPVEAMKMRPGRPNLLAFFRLARRLKTLNPDLVQTWMYHADLLGGLAARLAGVPAIAWGIRNGNLDPEKSKLTTRLIARICALFSGWIPNRILCCSEAAKQAHIDIGYSADKMAVIPNGFDLALFRPDPVARASVRKEVNIAPDIPLVGLIGRFDPQKNHAGFVEAAGLLHKRLPQVHFVLAGEGIDAANDTLARAIGSAGIGPVTRLLGLRRDVPRLMAGLDMLVSASCYGESFPNVLGEAMACAVPCVTTDVGDSAWIVGDTGKVVPPGDIAELSAAMRSLLSLPAPELAAHGERARSRIAGHFEIGEVVRHYAAFYQALAGTRANPAPGDP